MADPNAAAGGMPGGAGAGAGATLADSPMRAFYGEAIQHNAKTVS